MMIRGVILAVLFVVAAYALVVLMDMVVSFLNLAAATVDSAAQQALGESVWDGWYVDVASSAVSSAAWLVPAIFVAILVVYSMHTRRR